VKCSAEPPSWAVEMLRDEIALGGAALNLRRRGLVWSEIADVLDLADDKHARRLAGKYLVALGSLPAKQGPADAQRTARRGAAQKQKPRRSGVLCRVGLAQADLRRLLNPSPARPRPRRASVPGSAAGVELQTFRAVLLFRGAGAPVEKSAALLSVSMQPPPARNAAVVLVKAGAAAVSKKFALP
jgi:hypothetical protein